ncbi:glycoside hydrolase family 16 protein [Cylindrobasidium torrendii FP15055 ss-10]|uniref:Glycoside hydrolase family 16 protein n=1 Tax=Cylindrobasidium torrendii FP15055 ss-10 TaxID=1314674 RepID=A0A0D7B267_9AGAR|nr:glycoside hydrolase family 16 protein [Cylindrobasidium torrendii FP15055 ss-10]
MVSVGTSGDELDVEILGSDPYHWQTNMYAPPKAGAEPEYGVWSTIEDVRNVENVHRYFIDFDEDRIQWGVDGTIMRTLTKESTKRGGKYTYPSHEMRLQIALWDGSGAPGTSKWAGGPVDWTTTPYDVKAVVRSVVLECA